MASLIDFFAGVKLRTFFLVGGATLTVLLASVVLYNFNFGQQRYETGTIASETVKSPRAVTYTSALRTQEARERAASDVSPVFLPRTILYREQETRIASFLTTVGSIRSSESPPEEQIRQIERAEGLRLSREVATRLVAFDPEQWERFGETLQSVVLDFQQKQEISSEQLDAARQSLEGQARAHAASAGLDQATFSQVSRALLVPNLVVDEGETRRLRDEARDRISPIAISVDKGEVIFLAGQQITPFDIEKLEAVGLARPSFNLQRFLGYFIIVALLSFLSAYFFHVHQGQMSRVRRFFVIYGVLLLVLVLVAKLALPLKPIFAYLFPVPSFAILIYLLMGLPAALLAAAVGSVTVGLLLGNSFEIFLVQFISSLVGVFASYQVSRISSFLRVIAAIAIANFAAAFAFQLLTTGFQIRLAWPLLAAALLNGVLSVIAVVGSAVFISRAFNVATFMQLLELESPSHPLLSDLTFRAPGTYHHSVILANMAEPAARAVGADPLLTRVGVYYHDVGKMLNPSYFIENQDKTGNPHDRLKDPEESARRIIAHVTDGEKLARQHHLPDEVIHIIRSHHGTMLVEYFHAQAKERSLDPDPGHYRYPGPLPETKEAGIVMLADGVEALVRSLDEPTEGAIRESIEKIVERRKVEGQLNHCPLTFSELEEIKRSFAEVLGAVYHERLKYPDQSHAPRPA